MSYNWAGDIIIRDTVMWNKRAVLGYPSIFIPTDIREWFSNPDNEVISRSIQEIGLPQANVPGSFDLRAWKIWKYVAESVTYVTDKSAQGIDDFWQFPEETLMLQKGDCEDSSFLLATLLLASGISDHCVRVVLGNVISADGVSGHAWVVYQEENGVWSLLESTLDSVPQNLMPADTFTMPGVQYQYQPQFCLNDALLWSIGPVKTQMADYLKSRERKINRRIRLSMAAKAVEAY
ncbi:MAG: transglutaminase-like domain-containing protein [Methanotrichaceae archaeon]